MSLQPTFGKVYTFFSIKYVLLCALLTFETGSLISALSPSSSIFILGRAVSGVGAAAIFGGGSELISSQSHLRFNLFEYTAVALDRFSIFSCLPSPLELMH